MDRFRSYCTYSNGILDKSLYLHLQIFATTFFKTKKLNDKIPTANIIIIIIIIITIIIIIKITVSLIALIGTARTQLDKVRPKAHIATAGSRCMVHA